MTHPARAVIVASGDDPVTVPLLGRLAELASLGVLHDLLLVDVAAPDAIRRARAVLLDDEGSHEVDLFVELARRPCPLVRVGVVASAAAGAPVWAGVAAAGQELVALLRRLVPRDTRVVQARFLASGYDDPALEAEELFTSSAEANLVLLPEDRSSDDAIARPLRLDDLDVFAGHVATELCSQLGAWAAMATAPVDDVVAGAVGVGEPAVRIVRSVVRVAFGPPPPYDRIATVDGHLPLPTEAQPAPDQERAARSFADQVFGACPALHVRPSDPEPDDRLHLGIGSTIGLLLGEMAGYLRDLPRRIREGAGADVRDLAGDAAQAAIGADSWVETVWSGQRWSDDEDPGGSRLEGAELEERILASSGSNDAVLVPSGIWSPVVDAMLGVADGGSTGLLVTPPMMGTTRVALVEPGVLAPEVGALDPTIHALRGEEPVAAASLLPPEPPPRPEVPAGLPPLPLTPPDGEAATPTEPPPPPPLLLDGPSGPSGPAGPEQPESPAGPLTASPGPGGWPVTLLGRFTDRLDEQIAVADAGYQDAINALRQLAPSRNQERSEWPVFLASWAAGLAGLAIIGALVLLTPFHDLLQGRWMQVWVLRLLWFVGMAIVLAGTAGLLVRMDRASSRILARGVVGGLLGAAVVWLLAAFLPQEAADWIRELFGFATFLTIVLTTAAVVLALCVAAAAWSSGRQKLRSRARLLAWFTVLFIFLVSVITMSRRRGFVEQLSTTSSSKFLERIVAVSVVTIVLALVLLAWLRVQDQLRRNTFAAQVRWAKDQAVSMLEARRQLRYAMAQWLGTAAVLARLYWRPLGTSPPANRPDLPAILERNQVLKLDVATFAFTPRGELGLLARFRHRLAIPGWLRQQYRQLVEAFAPEQAYRSGAPLDEAEPRRPEGDAYVVRLEQVLAGHHPGERWRFAELVFEGALDHALREALQTARQGEYYENVLGSQDTVMLGSTRFEGTLAGFFDAALPAAPPALSGDALRSVQVAGSDQLVMASTVWWPTELFGPATRRSGRPDQVAELVLGDDGIVVMAVRSDWSVAFPMSQLSVLSLRDVVAASAPEEEPTEPPPSGSIVL